MMRKKIESAAGALSARYRNEPWFISTAIGTNAEEVHLLVRPSCPIKTHRDVEGYKVHVIVSHVVRPR